MNTCTNIYSHSQNEVGIAFAFSLQVDVLIHGKQEQGSTSSVVPRGDSFLGFCFLPPHHSQFRTFCSANRLFFDFFGSMKAVPPFVSKDENIELWIGTLIWWNLWSDKTRLTRGGGRHQLLQAFGKRSWCRHSQPAKRLNEGWILCKIRTFLSIRPLKASRTRRVKGKDYASVKSENRIKVKNLKMEKHAIFLDTYCPSVEHVLLSKWNFALDGMLVNDI